MTKGYHKSCGRESVQTSDENLHVDLPITTTELLKQSPSLQALIDASSLSQGSTASSGYCSDTNLCDTPKEQFQSNATKVIQPQGSFKHCTSIERDSKENRTTSSDGTASPAINMPKNLTCTNYENCSMSASSSIQYENFSPLNPPPLPPKSVKKAPYYENQPQVFSNMKADSKLHSNSCSSTSSASQQDYSTQMQSTCEPVSTKAERSSW